MSFKYNSSYSKATPMHYNEDESNCQPDQRDEKNLCVDSFYWIIDNSQVKGTSISSDLYTNLLTTFFIFQTDAQNVHRNHCVTVNSLLGFS